MAKLNYNRIRIANQLRFSEPIDTERQFTYGYWPKGVGPYDRLLRPSFLERMAKARRAQHVAAILALRKAKTSA